MVVAGLFLAALFFVTGCNRPAAESAQAAELDEAWNQYGYGAYDASLRAFKNFAVSVPTSDPRHTAALFGQATVWNWRRPGEDRVRAGEIYERIRRDFPRSDFAAWSALALARAAWLVPVGQTPDRGKVASLFDNVIANYPGSQAAEEATISLQAMRVESFDTQQAAGARDALQAFVRTDPGSIFLGAAYSVLSEAERVLGNPEARLRAEIAAYKAREHLARTIWEKNLRGPFLFNDPSALFKIAKIAEFDVGDFPTAQDYYQRFLHDNPTEKRRFFAEESLSRMQRTEDSIRKELLNVVPQGQ